MDRRHCPAYILIPILILCQQDGLILFRDQVHTSDGFDPCVPAMLNEPNESPHSVHISESQRVHTMGPGKVHKIRQ